MKRDDQIAGIEYRRLPESITVRDEDQEKRIIEGYFAKFDRWFSGPFFKEKIAPGAFARSLKDHDVRALWNHNPDFPLGRTRNNTLHLVEDDKGLWGQIDLPDTMAARDALTSVKRGDVSGASFGFEVENEDWNDDFTERTLTRVKLWEVSPVVFPAYPTTHVSARSLLPFGRPVGSVLAHLIERSRSGKMTVDEREKFSAILAGNNQAAATVEDVTVENEKPPEPEPEDPALTDRKMAIEARSVLVFLKLKQLGVIKPH